MEHTDDCGCAESLARALGGSAKRDGTGPLSVIEAIHHCPWCGSRFVEPELAKASRRCLGGK